MNKKRIVRFLHKTWKEWRLTVLLIIFVIIPVKSSLADWNWVPTGSMNPTILEGDLVFVNKLAYGLRFPLTLHSLAKWSDPKRGEIVICFSPEDDVRLVKRVIGEPGDIVEMKDNVLYINGEPVEYSTADSKYTSGLADWLDGKYTAALEDLDGHVHAVMSIPSVRAMRSFGPITVPDGQYFLMGDNRDGSRDSRFFGFVERESIIGRVKGIIISFDITDKYQPRFTRFLSPLQ